MERKQTLAMVVALLALVALPGLCTGGILLHACDCGEADACGHESECSYDPCGTVVARVGPQIVRVEAPSWITCVCFAHRGIPLDSRQAAQPEPGTFARSSLAKTPGFPPGDLPLLI